MKNNQFLNVSELISSVKCSDGDKKSATIEFNIPNELAEKIIGDIYSRERVIDNLQLSWSDRSIVSLEDDIEDDTEEPYESEINDLCTECYDPDCSGCNN